MKNYLLIFFKNGLIINRIVFDYKKENLESYFRKMNTTDASYLVYDLKLNKYAEGYVDRNGTIKALKRRTKWDY